MDSFTIKRSGLRLVTRIFGGTEPPPGAKNPGKSENNCELGANLGRIKRMMLDKNDVPCNNMQYKNKFKCF